MSVTELQSGRPCRSQGGRLFQTESRRVLKSCGFDAMAFVPLSYCALQRKIPWGIAATLVLILSFGCEGRRSAAQRIERASKSAGMDLAAIYPLGGKLTVDNEPPAAKSRTVRLVAVAYDAAKPDAKAKSNAIAFVEPDGSFELPALPPGKYVMLFAQLGHNPRMGFFGTDGLKNLYNDPEVNSKKPEFLIDHQAPGKTDYTFNLSVAGETPPAAPGPKAFVGTGPRHAPAQK
jgi:hypothetical protein